MKWFKYDLFNISLVVIKDIYLSAKIRDAKERVNQLLKQAALLVLYEAGFCWDEFPNRCYVYACPFVFFFRKSALFVIYVTAKLIFITYVL